jgi:hypothetical protein
MMNRRRSGLRLVVLLIAGTLFGLPGWSLDRQTYQELVFKVEHSGDPAAKAAMETLIKKGILAPQTASSRPKSAAKGDCELLVGEGLVQSALMRDFLKKEVPPQVLELHVRFADAAVLLNGRLDGPLFLNPRFEAAIDFSFVKTNVYRMRIFGLKVMGFEMKLFSSILQKYVQDALKRVFIQGCTTRSVDGPNGSIIIEVTINPDGLVPGLGKKAYLSGLDMRQRFLRFSFSLAR